MDDEDRRFTDAVDQLLARAGLTVTEDERVRLRRLYPLVRSKADRLRRIDLAYTEPAVTYRVPALPDPEQPAESRSD